MSAAGPRTGRPPVTTTRPGRRTVPGDTSRPTFFASALDGAPRWATGALAALQAAVLSLAALTIPAVAAFVATSADPSNAGVAWPQAVGVGAAVWLVWSFTMWVTNFLDPQRASVRTMLMVLMALGLVMSSAIPEAFGDKALVFALAYLAMQLGRTAFTAFALGRVWPENALGFVRIFVWEAVAGVGWVAGALADEHARLWWWVAAVLVEYASMRAMFWVPGLGASSAAMWTVRGEHMAERVGLFVIIALGESIIVTGATVVGLPWTFEVIAAFASSLVGSIAMWWIYFSFTAEAASEAIAEAEDPGAIARLAYTYFHLPLVAGIVVSAVGDELALVHPNGHVDLKTGAVLLAGPALYLAGDLLFRRVTTQRIPRAHVVALAALAALVPAAGALSPALLSVTTSSVLVAVAAAETFWRREAAA